MKKKNVFLLCFLAILFMFGGIVNTNQAKAATQTNESGKVFWTGIKEAAGSLSYGRTIALDSNSYPHICAQHTLFFYGNNYYFLQHYYWNGTAWIEESVDSSLNEYFGNNCSIAVDTSTDNVHISYNGVSSLKYAKKSNNAWATESVFDYGGNNSSPYTSLALDASKYPHIVYRDGNILKWDYWNGSSWGGTNIATIAGTGYYNSLAIDANNILHFSYINNTGKTLNYRSKQAGGSWSDATLVATLSESLPASLAVGSDNVVRIVYVDNNAIGVASNSGGTFSTSAVGNIVATQPSIAMDPQNKWYISYRNLSDFGLGYATNSTNIVTNLTSLGGNYTSIAYGDNNSFISYYNATNNTQDFVLVDSVVPTATVALTGKAGKEFSYNMSASDYAKMGGAKYYCIDESNTCAPLTAGTALTSATLTGIHNASSSTVKTVYFRVSDWAGNISSTTLTESAQQETTGESEKRTVTEDLKGQEVVNYDLSYIWKKLPNNSENYWIQTYRYKKYAKNYADVKKQAIKRYWKIKTNLYGYHKDSRNKLIDAESNYVTCYYNSACSDETLKSYKNKVEKYQKKMFRVRVKFYYTQKLSNKLRLKNSDLKKLTKKQAEKKLWLKVYDKGTKTWYNANRLKLITNTKQNTKKNTFATDIRYFKQKDTLFTIGVK